MALFPIQPLSIVPITSIYFPPQICIDLGIWILNSRSANATGPSTTDFKSPLRHDIIRGRCQGHRRLAGRLARWLKSDTAALLAHAITVRSQLGKGSAFAIEVPLAPQSPMQSRTYLAEAGPTAPRLDPDRRRQCAAVRHAAIGVGDGGPSYCSPRGRGHRTGPGRRQRISARPYRLRCRSDRLSSQLCSPSHFRN